MRGVIVSLIVLTVVALGGCTSVKGTYLADGLRGYMVSCRGPMQRWSACIARAGRQCGARGYTIRYSDEIERELIVSCTSRGDAFAATPH